jgi:hypothetical protein
MVEDNFVEKYEEAKERKEKRTRLNEKIQLAMGWEKVQFPEDETREYCPQGWYWRSPEGYRYEGNDHMVRDHLRCLDAVIDVLPAAIKVADAGESEELKQIINMIYVIFSKQNK